MRQDTHVNAVTPRLRRRRLLTVASFSLLAAACGNSVDSSPKAAAPAATSAITAPSSVASASVSPEASVAPTTAPAANTLSFQKTIQPIIEANCSSCHQAGGVGATHAPMATAGDAAKIASTIGKVTQSGYMPPWPASLKSVPLRDVRRLTDQQLADVLEWSSSGAVLDVPASTPLTAVPVDPNKSVRADLTVRMPVPYTGDQAIKDNYQCFIFEPAFTKKGFVVGTQFFPDDVGSVHHVIVQKVSAGERAKAEEFDAADPAVGWSCPVGMGGIGGDGIGGWVPGQRPRKYGEGLGIEFNPGDFIVAQMHYHHGDANYAGVSEKGTDQSSMSFEFAPEGTTITPLIPRTLVGPVELPCPSGATGVLCDRGAAIADVSARFGPTGGIIPAVLAQACGTTPEALGALSDGNTAKTTCDYNILEDGSVIDFMGHMHELGSSFRMTMNPGTDRETILLDIPKWDFGWQLNYQPITPVEVRKGDKVRIECAWDRSTQPGREPRYIVFAEGTQDEMCFATMLSYKR
jgi:mono/diheme cytochrome c family protein